MHVPAMFDRFRKACQPTEQQHAGMISAHRRLCESLRTDQTLRGIVVNALIQGSHRRGTALRGTSSQPCDVDVIVLTTLDRRSTLAKRASELFQPFLARNYSTGASQRARSWCITVAPDVRLDVVPMARPASSDVEAALSSRDWIDWSPSGPPPGTSAAGSPNVDWNRAEPLWIPDRKLERWEETHPLLLVDWTSQKNARCNGHYTTVVRAVKWWWRRIHPQPQHLRGYPVEHIVGECCPNSILTPADGIAATFESIASKFQPDVAALRTPPLPSRGVPGVDVLRRVDPREFAHFVREATAAAVISRKAINASTEHETLDLWSRLLGDAIR